MEEWVFDVVLLTAAENRVFEHVGDTLGVWGGSAETDAEGVVRVVGVEVDVLSTRCFMLEVENCDLEVFDVERVLEFEAGERRR